MQKNFTRYKGIKEIAYALDVVTRPIFRKRGFVENRIITDWDIITGAAIGSYSTPRKLVFSRDSKSDGILHVEVYDSGMAMELTYMAPVICEKIANYFGYRAVARLKIIQRPGGISHAKDSPKQPAAPVIITEETKSAVNSMLDGIDDEEMRLALGSLGSSIISSNPLPFSS